MAVLNPPRRFFMAQKARTKKSVVSRRMWQARTGKCTRTEVRPAQLKPKPKQQQQFTYYKKY